MEGTAMIQLEEDYADPASWDRFVESQPESRFCQLYGYAQAADVYGYASRHLCFLKDGSIVAVLPVSRARSLLFGRKLVSQPFSEYGGMLVSAGATSADLEEIFGLLREALVRNSLPLLELHGASSLSAECREAYLLLANPRHNAVLDLSLPLDELWSKALDRQARKAVKQAERFQLDIWQECSPPLIKDLFYPLYLQSMKRLGVPPHGVQYFLRCQAGLGERMNIFWAAKDGRVIAALLGFSCGDRVNITSTASDEAAWEYRPNDLLHWSYIKWARERNMRYFDFGSVRYAGQMQFKKKWGCSFTEDAYYLFSPVPRSSEARVFNSSGSSMTRMSRIWAKWVPDAVGRAVGPILRKHLVR
jgi:CelD/BcsL family acetyltransferase involved in cellulose biosynthesis